MMPLIQYGFGTGFVVTLCIAMEMLFMMSSLPLTVSLSSVRSFSLHLSFPVSTVAEIDHVCCGDHAGAADAGAAAAES